MNRLTGLVLLSGTCQSDTNIHYLSGFTAPDPFVFMKTRECQYLLVSSMEKGRAQKQSVCDTEVYTPADLGLNGRKAADWSAQIKALMDKAGVKRIQVATDFPVGLFKSLEKKKIPISLYKDAVCPERTVKSDLEIRKIRKSQRAAVAAMEAATAMIASSRISKDGTLYHRKNVLTSELVRQHILKTLIEQNCTGNETIVAGGEQGTDPHERGHGPLYAGESIIIDIFPRSEKTGYWGDLTRTVCRGPAAPELKKLYQAVKTAQAAALRTVVPGVCADDVHSAAKSVFVDRGYETKVINGTHAGFIHGTGHGVGLDIHERPRVGTSGETLEAGNIITVEPGLYYPGLGGVRIEDTVVVTEKGWRYLAGCAKKFELL